MCYNDAIFFLFSARVLLMKLLCALLKRFQACDLAARDSSKLQFSYSMVGPDGPHCRNGFLTSIFILPVHRTEIILFALFAPLRNCKGANNANNSAFLSIINSALIIQHNRGNSLHGVNYFEVFPFVLSYVKGKGAGRTRWVKGSPKLSPERGEGDKKGLKGVPKMRPNESR